MKKRSILPLTLLALSGVLFACSQTGSGSSTPASSDPSPVSSDPASSDPASSNPVSSDPASSSSEDTTTMRIGSLKGPTTLGLLNLISDSEKGEAIGNYTFDMQTQATTVVAALTQGNLDAALIPANLASTLYNRTSGAITCLNINTLNVLYCISGNTEITGISSLSGKTVYMTGQGSTPQYTVEHLLKENNITDCDIQYRSEATEVAALLANNSNGIGILPQPFVTVALNNNTALSTRFSLADEWAKVSPESDIVTGVTIVTDSFLSEHPSVVATFLAEQKESVEKASSDLDGTAKLAVEQGIIAAEAVAKKAIPQCAISNVSGSEMKAKLSGYLNVLYEANASSIGGALPGEDFYYAG